MKTKKTKIALATVSGKAYYTLVKELKERKLLFLSLLPKEHVPLDIKVVITTNREQHSVKHPNVLIFEDEMDPATIVDKAIRVAQGKQSYDKLVIGIDPGKTSGVAALADGNILETVTCSTLEGTVNIISKSLDRTPATVNVVKIGNGAPVYAEKLVHLLDAALPKKVVIETVSEAGTSHLMRKNTHRRGSRDVLSAIKIAERNGQVVPRRKKAQ